MLFSLPSRNLLCLYPELIQAVTKSGCPCAPRGKGVLEFPCPVIWHLSTPGEWVLPIPGRRFNVFFALAEVVWMWTGKGGHEFISFYNSTLKQFLDPGVPYFHGAYGRRVRHAGYSERPFRELPSPMTPSDVSGDGLKPVEVDQLHHVISKLEQDPYTRQAAVSLWDPIKDNLVVSRDHPCNNMLYFANRDGRLHLTVVIRSNDAVWGVPYNMVQFSHLQALIAASLGLKAGSYTVMCNNLHLYTDLYPDTLNTVSGWAESVHRYGVGLEQFSDAFFQDAWEMGTFSLDALDEFVNKAWESIEKQMRDFHNLMSNPEPPTTKVSNAFFYTKQMFVEDQLDRYDVPEYWKHLFTVLFAWHCRKSGAMDIYDSLLPTFPKPIQWLINDFDRKDQPCGA